MAHSASASDMGLDWLAERMFISILMFTALWIVGCFWKILKSNQRLALGEAFEFTPRCAYLRHGTAVERDHLLSARAV